MKTIDYIPSNTVTAGNGMADDFIGVRLDYNKQFFFNKATCDYMNLKKGEQVCFKQNEAEPKQWFICRHGEGFVIRQHNKNQMQLSNAFMYEKIIKSKGFDYSEVRNIRFKIVKTEIDGVEMFSITDEHELVKNRY